MLHCENVTLRYGRQAALEAVSFRVAENAICGLLGRNGAGKTSLLALLAAYRRPTSGAVRVLGADPYENARVMPQVALIYDKNESTSSLTVKNILALAAAFRPNWDADYAATLVKRFEVPVKKSLSVLSHGQRAAVHAVVGLAGRTPVTLYDEAYLGMDAAYRKLFIGEILADYMRYPRTILFSTHYIGEMEGLFSEAIVLDGGRVLLHEDCDTLRQRGVTVTGPGAAVDAFAAGRRVLSARALGGQKEAVLYGALTEAERATARRDGLALSAAPLQDLFIHMTEKGGTEDEA
ncbi:MAG: ABC transporter ATP-binding protein [Oscillospiraceae bacterium]|jgi:ABC-2 type transport system ATP-binding protein|nr:ABC transporter ATP-binding protein [Oscillospiraceae bacterium]